MGRYGDERSAPLRKIVARHAQFGLMTEEMECGHFNKSPKNYGYAPNGKLVTARRCPICTADKRG
jgi:hypothetical protein